MLLYNKIKKKYNKNIYSKFFNYFERYWKPKAKFQNKKYILEWNYYLIIKSINFDVKYLYLTNNIAEHINKVLNSYFNTKYPLFNDWKKALLFTAKKMNEENNPINRKNITSNILIHFVTNIRNNELDSKYLLNDNDIKILNSLSIPGSNLGNYIPLSEFFNNHEYDVIENNDSSKDKNYDNESENSFDSSSSSENNMNDTNQESDNNKPNNKNIFYKLEEEKDLSYNLTKFINIYDIKDLNIGNFN